MRTLRSRYTFQTSKLLEFKARQEEQLLKKAGDSKMIDSS